MISKALIFELKMQLFFACSFMTDVHVPIFSLEGTDDFDSLSRAERVANFNLSPTWIRDRHNIWPNPETEYMALVMEVPK